MRNLFNLENPFIQFLSRVGDLIILNALFLVCCVPVVTVGASIAALQKSTQNILYEEGGGVVKEFFRAFRDNFKQATLVWLVMLAFAVSGVFNYMFILGLATGIPGLILKGLLGFLAVIVVILGAYIFPLMARYDNRVMEHAKNALILAIVKLPRTIALVALEVLPLLIALISMKTFLNTLVFWITLGFGFTSYMSSFLLKPVFAELEGETGTGVQIMN